MEKIKNAKIGKAKTTSDKLVGTTNVTIELYLQFSKFVFKNPSTILLIKITKISCS